MLDVRPAGGSRLGCETQVPVRRCPARQTLRNNVAEKIRHLFPARQRSLTVANAARASREEQVHLPEGTDEAGAAH